MPLSCFQNWGIVVERASLLIDYATAKLEETHGPVGICRDPCEGVELPETWYTAPS